ncbi:MAG TPA: hypothetical protein ACHBY5_00355 [Arsenophonus apicola]
MLRVANAAVLAPLLSLTSSPTFTLRDSGGGFPLVGDYLIAQKPGSCC